MRKFYYYSNRHLNYLEISKFWLKFIVSTCIVSVLISFLLWKTASITFFKQDRSLSEYRSDSIKYANQIAEILTKYELLDNKLNNLVLSNNDMRIKLNREIHSNIIDSVGTGGDVFEGDNLFVSDMIGKTKLLKDRLSKKIQINKINLDELSEQIKYFDKISDYIPAIRPCEGGYYGDSFGSRMHPILGIRRMHPGQDIVVYLKTPVYAPGNGKVTFTGTRGGYGRVVEIDHGFGYKTRFAHLSHYKVKRGDTVKRGDLIALSGDSGSLSTGAHLHYEVRKNGIAINPLDFISEEVTIKDYRDQINN